MKKLIVVLLVILVACSGVAFLWSCGGGGGGGGEETVDLDMDGYDSSVDCDDSASSCTDDCVSDVDGDGLPDCLDLCLDTDLDGYGDDNSATVVGTGADEVGSCTSDGSTPCAGGGAACLDLDCDDDPATGFSINPGAAELCDDGTDNDCDGDVDCYETICAGDDACSACTDADGDGYLGMDLSCSGGDDCDDGDFDVNPGSGGCQPDMCDLCVTDSDCFLLPGGKCLLIDGEMRCTSECTEYTYECPDGYACVEQPGGEMQCLPASGSCTCLAAEDDGAMRLCEQSNGFGTCTGTETCDPATGWSECTADVPAAEVCDGLDNDCDGSADEGFPDLGDPCSVGVGACYDSGNMVCTWDGAGTECDAVAGQPSDDVCNSVDDDCDGSIDEDFGAGGSVTYTDLDGTSGLVLEDSCGTGDCAGGTVVCGDDQLSLDCSTSGNATSEICDYNDNDCDGEVNNGAWGLFYVDSDNDNFGSSYLTTIGCNPPGGYAWVSGDCDDSDAGINPQAVEICDGVDNDCREYTADGSQDPDTGDPCDGSDPDFCTEGTYSCSGGSLVCSDNTGDTLEVCDGTDNDCDGETDELGAQACYEGPPATRGVGECADGTQTCSGGEWGSCTGQTLPATEVCNGLDDDCDDTVDESFPEQGTACTVPGKQGVCEPGTYTSCTSGVLVCMQVVFPTAEACNGLDDDCDGTVDNGATGTGGSCDGADADLCADGIWDCTGGTSTCTDAMVDDVEMCNGLDDDCDGVIDEGDLCPDHLLCNSTMGLCFTSCSSSADCYDGYYCSGATCLALKSQGASCSSNSECSTGFCADGVCCDNACDGLCQSCALPGNVGICTYVPSGQDPADECADISTCDGNGGCT